MIRNALACLLALAPLVGCDVALFPETAQYTQTVTARATVNVEAVAMPGDGAVEVEVELGEVLLHRAIDDAWIVVGAESSWVALDGVDGDCAFEDVPVGYEEYDRVTFVVQSVRVRTAQGWESVDLIEDEAEAEAALDVVADITLDLRFDLEASLAHEPAGWSFVPVLDAEASTTPH